jgi:hypothetical protein
MQAVPDPPEIARRARTVLRLTENAHLPFDKLMALSKAEGPFGRPFDRLTVLSKVEGLTALSKVEASKGCVTLIPRHCGVLPWTPHSSGFRPAAELAGWTFSVSLSEVGF